MFGASVLDQPRIEYCQSATPSSELSVFGSGSLGQFEREWQNVIQSLQGLAYLEDDWDGAGSNAPDWLVVETAIEVARLCCKLKNEVPGRACATPAGTILFAWYPATTYCEWEIFSPTSIESMIIKGDGSVEHATYALPAATMRAMQI